MTRHESHPHGTPCWTDLQTPDPAAAKEFYSGLFGWSFVDEDMPQGGTYSMAQLEGRNVAALSGQQPGAEGAPPAWATYLAVDDVDVATARAQEAGGQVAMPVMDVMDAGRMSFVVDPVGAFVGLWQAGQHIGAQTCNEPGTLTWNELVTPDTSAALPFYEQVVGLTSSVDEIAPGVPYTLFKAGDREVAGSMPPQGDAEVPSHWAVYFATADTDASVARTAELGGTVLLPPMDIPPGRMAVVQDPQGAVLYLLQHHEAPQ